MPRPTSGRMAAQTRLPMFTLQSITTFWRQDPALAEMTGGAFGENLTTEGLLEDGLYRRPLPHW
jgi:MOSC domain-containing protein YiiM